MTDNNDLQFERAQFDGEAPKPGCQLCQTPLSSSYFEVNGQTVCNDCCQTLRQGIPAGSRAGRVLRATASGAGAGLAGAIVYWGILAATGYEFGLIAIVVGFAVGKAVHWGSRARGGWAYQTLAVALTYLAIVGASVPMIVTELMKEKPTAETQTATPDGVPAPAAASTAAPETAQAATIASTAAPATTPAEATDGEPAGLGMFLLALGAVLLIACVAPFLAGVQNVVGIIIIGIGMYEAWKLNRRLPLVITGPHALVPSGTGTLGQ